MVRIFLGFCDPAFRYQLLGRVLI
uniref:Uncharacterized protein n=1 Tax=Rhizophora mucronata TaxID=61149 RepID=A0A2P2PFN5_RHIMU